MKSAHRLAVVLVVLAAPAQSMAVSVFLNGTKVDGLVGTKIDKCAVEFDAQGNVQLACPGYVVKTEAGSAATGPAESGAVPTGPITRKYYLVTEQAERGMSGFDIELYVNSKFIRRLRNEDEQIVSEVTRHMLPGKNVVTFIARKKQAEAASFSKSHFFRAIIGEGNDAGDRVMIDDAMVTFERTAADTGDLTQEFTVVAR